MLGVDRLGCNPGKIQKVAEKAWRSTLPLPHWPATLNNADNEGKTLRAFMGCLFVFRPLTAETMFLITVLQARDKKYRKTTDIKRTQYSL